MGASNHKAFAFLKYYPKEETEMETEIETEALTKSGWNSDSKYEFHDKYLYIKFDKVAQCPDDNNKTVQFSYNMTCNKKYDDADKPQVTGTYNKSDCQIMLKVESKYCMYHYIYIYIYIYNSMLPILTELPMGIHPRILLHYGCDPNPSGPLPLLLRAQDIQGNPVYICNPNNVRCPPVHILPMGCPPLGSHLDRLVYLGGSNCCWASFWMAFH